MFHSIYNMYYIYIYIIMETDRNVSRQAVRQKQAKLRRTQRASCVVYLVISYTCVCVCIHIIYIYICLEAARRCWSSSTAGAAG